MSTLIERNFSHVCRIPNGMLVCANLLKKRGGYVKDSNQFTHRR